ncbi:hypothetical protein [Bradyrhizobium sp. USDA 4473]
MNFPDFDQPFDPNLFSIERWARVPEPIRKSVEQYVAARLPDDILAKLDDLHARGIPIDSDPAFFHFGGGLVVRNLCRERLSDQELAKYCPFCGDWDDFYVAVLAAIGAMRDQRNDPA